jgi:N-dimethylarginine dimethylaminohydrolase
MNMPAKGHRYAAKGYDSETGRLRKAVMCPPAFFDIVEPINAVQWLYYSDGLPRPDPRVMVQQHRRLVEILQEEGVEVELLPPVRGLPYQHATRDIGVVVGDTIVVSCLRERTRRLETQVAEPVLRKYGLRMVTPERGFIEGGDVIVDNGRLWVGLGARTDEPGAEFLHRAFGRDFDVVPLRFGPEYTHLDTIFGVLGQGHALVYEPAFEPASLRCIRDVYPSIISLADAEQQNAGANVLCLSPDKVISIAENHSVNEQLLQLGYQVVTVPFSEVIKSGGSVRCDTLPIDRDPASSEQVLTG